jgi:hypothetical protein
MLPIFYPSVINDGMLFPSSLFSSLQNACRSMKRMIRGSTGLCVLEKKSQNVVFPVPVPVGATVPPTLMRTMDISICVPFFFSFISILFFLHFIYYHILKLHYSFLQLTYFKPHFFHRTVFALHAVYQHYIVYCFIKQN